MIERLMGESRRDCTAAWSIKLYKPYTCGEFINEILAKYPKEWGCITIKRDNKIINEFLYTSGKVTYGLLPDDEIANMKIISVKGDGGYTLMDYVITIESEVSEKDSEIQTKDAYTETIQLCCNIISNVQKSVKYKVRKWLLED